MSICNRIFLVGAFGNERPRTRLRKHTSPKIRLNAAVFYTLFFHRLTKVFVTKKTPIVWSGFKHTSTWKVSERCVIGFYRQHPLKFTAIYVIWRGSNFYYLLINFAGLTLRVEKKHSFHLQSIMTTFLSLQGCIYLIHDAQKVLTFSPIIVRAVLTFLNTKIFFLLEIHLF